MDFFSRRFFGNSVEEYLYAAAVFAAAFAVAKLFQLFVLSRLKRIAERTKTKLDDELIAIVETMKPRVYTLIALFAALRFLRLSPTADRVVGASFLILITWEAVQILQRLADFGVRAALDRRGEGEEGEAVARNLVFLVKIALWAFSFLFVLSQLGINITSLIAGLGIGGIAVALALQNVLGDLFSSFSIYFDKPFKPGDVIVVGGQTGKVKTIGLKTTRLQTLRGEELVVSNRELTTAQINNFGRMKERRVDFTLGVTYATPTEKLKRIPGILKAVIEATGHCRFDRAHFKSFGESALEFEAVFFVDTSEHPTYMDARQAVNYAIREAFEKEGIDFAFPTRTVVLEK